mmetsp:Transcript_22531/g.55556  ORF Transcript_22531/g.55556 Transcript_22531/m.55556 type:complete len:361 (+) Transcript_22531:55-1137(+)
MTSGGSPSSSSARSASTDRLTAVLEAAKTSILSVGSGDGSQQASIVQQGHRNLIATFYDSRKEVLCKYPGAEGNLKILENNSHGKVLFDVDATRLDQCDHHDLGRAAFDIIFFSFPHTGVPNHDPSNVPSNQALLLNFMRCAVKLLTPTGEILITIKTGLPYDKWQLPRLLGECSEIKLLRTQALDKSLFPGYVHRMTKTKNKVKDDGAQVFVLGREGDAAAGGAPMVAEMGDRLLKIVSLPPIALSDEEVGTTALSILGEIHGAWPTVLDIRWCFDTEDSLQPDTRQLNRVLYELERRGRLECTQPKKPSKSQKPTWRISKGDGQPGDGLQGWKRKADDDSDCWEGVKKKQLLKNSALT